MDGPLGAVLGGEDVSHRKVLGRQVDDYGGIAGDVVVVQAGGGVGVVVELDDKCGSVACDGVPDVPGVLPALLFLGQGFGSWQRVGDGAVVAAGFDCPEWDEHNSSVLAATSGTCSDSLTMATYASDTSLEKQLDLWKGFGFEADFLIGKNWMVNGEDSEALRQKLGGTIFKVSGD